MTPIIGLDFDETIAVYQHLFTHREVPGAFQSLKEFRQAGASLILNSNRLGPLKLWAKLWVQQHVGFKLDAPLWPWSMFGGKPYAHLFVDDRGDNEPLIPNPFIIGGKPCLDWSIARPRVLQWIDNFKQGKVQCPLLQLS